MPVRGVVSTLPDQRYVAAVEKELEWAHHQIELLQRQIEELRRSK